MIEDRSIGYSFLVEFIDPLKAKTSEWHGAGVRLENRGDRVISPMAIMRNVGDTPSEVNAVMVFTRRDGIMGEESIAELRLLPAEVAYISSNDFLGRMAPHLSAGIASGELEFKYSTSPGTVIAAALSVDSTGNQVFRVPLVDPDAVPSSTGGCPWNLENGAPKKSEASRFQAGFRIQ